MGAIGGGGDVRARRETGNVSSGGLESEAAPGRGMCLIHGSWCCMSTNVLLWHVDLGMTSGLFDPTREQSC
jgi:hypothetical protein